jgi:trigger factor
MNVVVEDVGPCRKKLSIEIPTDEVAKEHATVLKEVARTVSVSGFRRGKAPQKVVAARFAGEIVKEVEERLVPKAYHEALKDEELIPVNIVDMEEAKYEAGGPLSFSVTCDVQPDFALPVYTGIELERKQEEVGEDKIEKALESILEQFATFEDVDRAAEKGDFVEVDYEGVMRGQALSEMDLSVEAYGKGEGFWLALEGDSFLPGFADGLVGTAKGEKVQVQVDFPADFKEEKLQNGQATYYVDVKTVRARQVPELSEDIVKQMGMESEEALRARIKDDLEQRFEANETRRLKQEVINFLSNGTDLELPESLVQRETQQAVYDMVSDITRSGASREDIEERKGEIFDLASRSASDRVKIRFILTRIADEEDLVVAPAEVNARIRDMAEARGVAAQILRKELEEKEALEDLEESVRLEKTLDFLLEKANIKV